MFPDNFLCEIDLEIAETSSKSKKTKQVASKNSKAERKSIKLKKGGYRPVLVDESDLKRESIELIEKMKRLDEGADNWSQQDMVAFYMVIYLDQRYPNQLFQNFNPIINQQLDENQSEFINKSRSFENLITFKNKNVSTRLKSLKQNTLFDLINNFNLHSVPYSARFTLANWYLHRSFKLNLYVNQIPASLEVLEMQAKGERCVSLIYNSLDKLVMNERDCLSFLLHDLVHAYKMFNNDYLQRGQIGFYRCLLKLFRDQSDSLGFKLLNDLIQHDETFSNDFDYLISDMNSHPKHLFYYFKAILILAYKRKFNSKVLDGQSFDEFDRHFEIILTLFEMSDKEKEMSRQMILSSENFRYKEEAIERFNLVDFTLLDNFFLRV